MDTIGKVEEAIKSFREKQKRDEEEKSRAKSASEELKRMQKTRSDLNLPVSLGLVAGKEKKDGNEDRTMEEFDQFVQYHEMKKQTEVISREMLRSEEIEIRTEIVPSECGPESEVNEFEDNGPEFEDNGFDKVVDIVEECAQDDSNSEEVADSDDDLLNGEEEYLFPTPDEIKNTKAPEVGMVFSTLDEAVRFVNVYGKISGFAVVKGRNYKQRKITLQCNKSRKSEPKSAIQRQRRTRVLTKTNCQMNVTVKLVERKWQIISCYLVHNHDLVPSPSLTKFFLSHRTMTENEIMLSKLLQEIRVKPQKIMTIFRRLSGSFGSLKFGKKNVHNLKQAERRSKRNTDIACTLKYIERIQLTKPGFCCKMEVDGEGAVRSIFWTDARSRLDYKLFGEIICFDTTYITNRYNLPFAPIIGINGHAKTIVFGWALLKDQKADTFEWLFKSFVEIMEGKKPKLILTDQDAAMKVAISNIFADVFHRFCIWHILQNLKENMSSYMADKEGMEDTIISLIMESLHIKEFETGWEEMVATYDCAGHDHIKRMWEAREKFVPAYFKGCFCPFTRSTGRSESFNSNFKDYVMRKDTIENFLKQYELFQENVIENENADRYESSQKNPAYWCNQPIERHAGKIYTKGIYLKFVTELLNSTAFGVDEIVKDRVYELYKMFNYSKPEYRRSRFTVCADRKAMTFECECSKFEKDGILCCHILRLFTQWDIVKIPYQYVMARWTVEFREKELLKHKTESIEVHGDNTSESSLRYAMLMNSINDVCADLSRDPNKSKIFIEEVHKLHKKLMTEDVQQPDNSGNKLKDPPVIKRKSAKSNKPNEEDVDSAPTPAVNTVDIWVNEDGSISKPLENKTEKVKSANKRKRQVDGQLSSKKDPPISNSKSVNKGNRMKPQSEKNSKRRKGTKKSSSSGELEPTS